MGIAKHNRKSSVFTYDGDTKEWEYRSLSDLADWEKGRGGVPGQHVYPVVKFWRSESKFGPSYVAVVPAGDSGALVNMPSHLNDVIDEIIEDPEAVEDVNSGRAGFKLRSYNDRNGVMRWSVEFIEMTTGPELPF